MSCEKPRMLWVVWPPLGLFARNSAKLHPEFAEKQSLFGGICVSAESQHKFEAGTKVYQLPNCNIKATKDDTDGGRERCRQALVCPPRHVRETKYISGKIDTIA